jgi:molybdopterin converting factor subunit 1
VTRGRPLPRLPANPRHAPGVEKTHSTPPQRAVQIKALFFASYRDIAGTHELSVELPVGASVADLVGQLRRQGSGWPTLPREPAVAVNLTYAPLATPLAHGDEVAFIPPVSGG